MTGFRPAKPMSVTVKYFASLRERLGETEQQCQIPKTGCSVAELWAQLNAPIDLDSTMLVAINQNYASLGSPISDGDEVAFFPPVTGG